ncbi:tol-Pal system protein TolA [Medicago truncatula]|uniref:tol-Pal system protein TolA n=1 Tax=Medicago truncatula TaxID=3880 RepID=UPI000D2F3876|nr:tol-Pal system protein TolA [Medicago truncatula]
MSYSKRKNWPKTTPYHHPWDYPNEKKTREEFSYESMRKDVKYHARTKSELQSHMEMLDLINSCEAAYKADVRKQKAAEARNHKHKADELPKQISPFDPFELPKQSTDEFRRQNYTKFLASLDARDQKKKAAADRKKKAAADRKQKTAETRKQKAEAAEVQEQETAKVQKQKQKAAELRKQKEEAAEVCKQKAAELRNQRAEIRKQKAEAIEIRKREAEVAEGNIKSKRQKKQVLEA